MYQDQPKAAYDRVQQSLAPSSLPQTLQVEASVRDLQVLRDELAETIYVLLRRIEPVTGDVGFGSAQGSCSSQVAQEKVPLAGVLDCVSESLRCLADRVNVSIRALQI